MKLFYCPLESYRERYTYFLSSPNGWAESWFNEYFIDFVRVSGIPQSGQINVGSVLDAYGRSLYSMSQMETMVSMIRDGHVKDGDVVYVEDFWTPGVESLFYIRQLTGIKFKVATFCWAQSIDDTDFTYSMRNWLAPMEVGMSRAYDYIFFASSILTDLAEKAGWEARHCHKVGLPYHSQRLQQQLSGMGFVPEEKEDFVLFASRFDSEKNPHFFLDLVELCPDIAFKLAKPRKHLTNDPTVQERVDELLLTRNNLEVVDTSDKLDYYSLLSRAKVLFNCAKQDWVSFVLLDGITFDCNPLFPCHKDFPWELRGFPDHIYANEDRQDACERLRKLMTKPFDPLLKQVVDRHDASWKEALEVMGFLT